MAPARSVAPHRLDNLIAQLFTEEADRELARKWAVQLDRDGAGNRSEALIREAARMAQRPDGGDMTPEAARDWLRKIAEAPRE